MAEPFVQFCPGQSDISCQLAKVTHIDPSYGGGIDRIELDGIDVVQHPFPRPLVAGGVDEIHAIADGFSLGFANAVIGGDWFISGLSRESYVRLRITFAGAARFGSDGEIMAQLAGSARACSYAIQPGGARMSSSFDGGQDHHFCTLSLSRRFLIDKIGMAEDHLPKALTQAWRRNTSAFGEYSISDRTRLAVRDIFEIAGEGNWRTFEIRSIAYGLLRLLLNDWREMKTSHTTRVSIRPDERAKLYAIMQMVADDPQSVGTIRQLSKDWGLNRNKLHCGFKHLFGRSITQFAVKQRIERAKQLLRETDARVSDIAEEVGYSEPTNFTSSFKMHVGETPLRYRKRLTAVGQVRDEGARSSGPIPS
jgi:AraC-like DNA-binding protein|tara:strand:- start:1656 stop:2750 length:1095 start_codon:yes stop_codon:yes gene_type:complete